MRFVKLTSTTIVHDINVDMGVPPLSTRGIVGTYVEHGAVTLNLSVKGNMSRWKPSLVDSAKHMGHSPRHPTQPR